MGGPGLKSSFQDLGPHYCEEHMKTYQLERGATRCTHQNSETAMREPVQKHLRVVSFVQNDLCSSSMHLVCPDCIGVKAPTVSYEERRSVQRELGGEAAWDGLVNSLGSLYRSLVFGDRTMTKPGRGSARGSCTESFFFVTLEPTLE